MCIIYVAVRTAAQYATTGSTYFQYFNVVSLSPSAMWFLVQLQTAGFRVEITLIILMYVSGRLV